MMDSVPLRHDAPGGPANGHDGAAAAFFVGCRRGSRGPDPANDAKRMSRI